MCVCARVGVCVCACVQRVWCVCVCVVLCVVCVVCVREWVSVRGAAWVCLSVVCCVCACVCVCVCVCVWRVCVSVCVCACVRCVSVLCVFVCVCALKITKTTKIYILFLHKNSSVEQNNLINLNGLFGSLHNIFIFALQKKKLKRKGRSVNEENINMPLIKYISSMA